MVTRLTLLIACLILGGCADPDADWELAARDDSTETYLEFLARHPDAAQADLARGRMAELKVISAWERAEFKDTYESFSGFIAKYPDSEFAADANNRIMIIERDSQWKIVDGSNDKTLLSAFMQAYPQAPQLDQAQAQITTILSIEEAAKPKERAGAFRLQLAAFRTATSADTELRRLVELFPGDTLLGPIRIETPVANAANGRFLLKSVPMTGAEARALCARLEALRQECMVVNR